MPKQSYAYSVGNIRAREVALLSNTDIEQMLSLSNENDAALFLRDKGYGNPMNSGDIDSILTEQTQKLWKYVLDISPDKTIFDPFIYENDYHNYKVILKGIMRRRDYSKLFLYPTTVDTSVLEQAVKDKKFSELPEHMSDAALRAYDILAQTGDAQLSDGVLDKSLMEAQINSAAKHGIDMMNRIIETTVFYSDIKVALRGAAAGKNSDFFRQTLCKTGGIDISELITAAASGEKEVLEFLEKQHQFSGAKAAEQYKISSSDFEKYADDYILEIASKGKTITLGPEPLIGYLMAGLREIKTVKIVAYGIRIGMDEQKTRERLRKLYG